MKRKGYRCEAGSEGSVEQRCEPMNKNRIQGASVGRAGNWSRSPYPSRTRSVDPAVVHRRRLSLPREVCFAKSAEPAPMSAAPRDAAGPSRLSKRKRQPALSNLSSESRGQSLKYDHGFPSTRF